MLESHCFIAILCLLSLRAILPSLPPLQYYLGHIAFVYINLDHLRDEL